MKKVLIALALVFAAVPALAQETYSIAATAPQVTRVDRARLKQNSNTCSRLLLATGCTQAQACVAANAVGGASCTQAQARARNAEIFAATQPGRESFVFSTVVDKVQEFTATAAVDDLVATRIWWTTLATRAQKDAICTAQTPSLGNGCEIFQ